MLFRRKPYEVICVGSISKDVFFPTDEGIVIETPEDTVAQVKVAFELGGKYRVRDRYEAVGGVAANVSCGLARLGIDVACYSNRGNDEIGRFVSDVLRQEGVATRYLSVENAAKTDLSAIIVLMQNAERTIFHNRDANEKLAIRETDIRNTEWLFVSALNGPWEENLKTLLDIRERYDLKLALNPGQHNIRENPGLLMRALRSVDILLLNKDEAVELSMQSPERPSREQLDDELFLLEFLRRAGAKMIGMTDGKRGAWGYDGREYWFCPIHTRGAVVDSTGCGDAFGSGFFSAILEGKTIDVALRYGMAQSGSVIGFYGAIEGLLRKEEMEEHIEQIIPRRLR